MLRYSYSDEVKQYLEKISNIFLSLADYGLELIEDVAESDFISEENNSIIYLFRNCVAYVDALAENYKIPSPESIQMLSRCIFENRCHLQYILKSNIKERATAYQVFYIRNRIRNYKKYDVNSSQRSCIQSMLIKNGLEGEINLFDRDFSDDILNLESLLSRSPYNKINAVFENFRKQRKQHEFYSYDTKCRNLYQLCNYLDYPFEYDIYYRNWSGVIHSSAVYSQSLVVDGDRAGVDAIRSLYPIDGLYEYLHHIITMLYRRFVEVASEKQAKLFCEFHHKRFLKMRNEVRAIKVKYQKTK